MGEPKTSITTSVPLGLVQALDEYRSAQRAIPSRSAVLRAALLEFLCSRRPVDRTHGENSDASPLDSQ